MRRSTIALIITGCFALALIGGGAAGILLTRFVTPRNTQSTQSAALTLDDLQLSNSQRDQIRQIWEGVKDMSDEYAKEANQLKQQREDKLYGLLDKEQQEKFSKANQEYNDRISKLKSDRQKALQKAIESTRKLLSDHQRQTYDAILKERLGSVSDAAGGSSHAVWLTSSSPATQPADQTSMR